MKKLIILPLTLILSAALVSCSKEMEDASIQEQEKDFVGDDNTFCCELGEGVTRAHFNSVFRMIWDKDDAVKVISGNTVCRYRLISGDGTGSALFSGAAVSTTPYYAISPWSDDTTIQDGKFSGNLPAERVCAPDVFPAETSTTLAKSTTRTLKFKNIYGILRLQLSLDDITSIVISGNDGETLAGDFETAFDESGLPVSAFKDGGSKTITLTPEGTTFAKGLYFIPVLPATFAKGITMSFTSLSKIADAKTSTQATARRAGKSALTVGRAAIKSLGKVDSDIVWEYSNVVMKPQTAGGSYGHFIDFQTGNVFYAVNSAYKHCNIIDACYFFSGTNGACFLSPGGTSMANAYTATHLAQIDPSYTNADIPTNWSKRLISKFYLLSTSEMNAEKFAALERTADITSLHTFVSGDPSDIKKLTTAGVADGSTKYIAFKTYDTTLGNQFGVIEMVQIVTGANALVKFNYKMSKVTSDPVIEPNTSSVVKVVKVSDKWQMQVNGAKFYIKGAAANNMYSDIDDFGGNCFRTYNPTDAAAILDQAYANGLMVTLGLVVNDFDKYDYTDKTMLSKMKANIKSNIEQFMSHPALLMWSIGNESEPADGAENADLFWKNLEDLAKMAHELDPNHPVCTAMSTSSQTKLSNLAKYCPDVDVVMINCYLPNLPGVQTNIDAKWSKPYIISEFGPRGTWQIPDSDARKLPWKDGYSATSYALVEQTSTQKAADYADCYNNYIKPNESKGCIGSFVFLWGYQTHGQVLGWYGLQYRNGYAFAAADEMQKCWTGEYPKYKAPVINNRSDCKMNNKRADDVVYTTVGADNTAYVTATSPSNAPLRYYWLIVSENDAHDVPEGADVEIKGLITDNTLQTISFKSPSNVGAYRLVALVFDDAHKKVASAVIPFYVKSK